MRIAVAVQEKGVDARVDPRFGRAPFFALYDTSSGSMEFRPNSAMNAASGAGLEAAKLMADWGVDLVLAGEVGPKAQDVLNSRGIRILKPKKTTLKEALSEIKEGGSLE
jgi:predicted Fe-Mo cluster-binding NifX family protein